MQALWIHADPRDEPEVVELDNFLGSDSNPWFVAQRYFQHRCDRVVDAEKVRTPFQHVHLFIDEMGSYTQPVNIWASMVLYPGRLFGPILVVRLNEVITDGEHDLELANLSEGQQRRVLSLLGGS